MLVIVVLRVWDQIEKPEKHEKKIFVTFCNRIVIFKIITYHFVIVRFDTSDVMRSSTVQGSHQEY